MNDLVEENKFNRTSFESLVLAILGLLSGIAFFLLVPGKSMGFNILKPITATEEFNKYVFFLFLIVLLFVFSAGSSIIAVTFGIKDYRGIFRGAHIRKGKTIYLAGIILGSLGIGLLICFFFLLVLF